MSIAGCKDIEFIIKKLQELEEKLGGRKQKDKKKFKNQDEFDIAKIAILENIHFTRGKVNEMQQKMEKNVRKVDIAQLRMEIKSKMTELDQQLYKLDKIVKSQSKSKKITSIDKNNKAKLAKNFREIYEDLKAEFEGRPIERVREHKDGSDFKKDKQYLFNDLKKYNRGGGGENRRDHADEDEKRVMAEWKQRDEQIESKLEDINILLDEIKAQAEQQGQDLMVINEATKKTGQEVQKTKNQVVTENMRLKELVKKYRSPSKCCLDMTLCLFIVGLISIIVMMLKS